MGHGWRASSRRGGGVFGVERRGSIQLPRNSKNFQNPFLHNNPPKMQTRSTINSMNTWLDPIIKAYQQYFHVKPIPYKLNVWEVGSRDGHDGVEIATRLGGGEADAVLVEANLAQAIIISQNYPLATVLPVAAYDRHGLAQFEVYEGNEGDVGSSSLNLGWKSGDGLPSHVVTVPTMRLDALIGDEVIDVMKIDVEGKSCEVLAGLGAKVHQVRVLHVETEKWSGSDVEVESYLRRMEFKLVSVSEQYGDMPDQVWVNLRLTTARGEA